MHTTATLFALALTIAAVGQPDAAPHAHALEEARALIEGMELHETRLADPGRGDAVALRYTPETGRSVSYDIRVAGQTTQTMNGQRSLDLKIPVTRFTFTSTVQSAGEGAHTIETTVDAASVEGDASDPFVQAMSPLLTSIVGSTITSPVTSLGVVEGYRLAAPEGTPREAVEYLETAQDLTIIVPLPARPVAPGAVWHHRSLHTSSGIETDLLTTYTLESIEPETLRIRASSQQLFPEGPLDIEGSPPGTSVEITDATGVGAYTYAVDRATGVAHRHSYEYELDMTMVTTSQGQRTTVMQEATMTMDTVPGDG